MFWRESNSFHLVVHFPNGCNTQESKAPSKFLKRQAGAKELEPLFASFPGALTGGCIRNSRAKLLF